MDDFLKFKKMITPVIIQILFWIGVAACLIMGLITLVGAAKMFRYNSSTSTIMVLSAFMWILLGPIVTRIYCELLIVIFSINDTLTDVKNLIKNKNQASM